MIKRKISETTFVVEDLVDKSAKLEFRQPIHAERLVRLDMPELELSPDQPRRLEMRTAATQPFNEFVIERFGADGRALLRTDGGGAAWHDLSRCEYRWLA